MQLVETTRRSTPDLRAVQVEGEPSLVDRLEDALRGALAGRGTVYRVDLDSVGRCGEVMVSITGRNGRLPLLLEPVELEPGFFRSIVLSNVDKYGL